mmetsp:Transcript_70399/g.82030  ORF Transcript_70399/g.82030 Transcript_70399/m.82030 type:complete len:231 (+) Transcript_70399:46-738(+)
MFEFKRTHPIIPGYTGHLQKPLYGGDYAEEKQPRSEIPGYTGFVKGVKSENMFGKTYGVATLTSSSNNYYKGSEITPEIRYTSMLQASYINQRNVRARSVAEIVGVIPKKPVYENNLAELTYQPTQQELEKTWRVVGGLNSTQSGGGKERNFQDSQRVFYGEDVDKPGPVRLGEPVPGYTGVNRRIQADNIFGATYADSRRKGDQSLKDITVEKTLNFQYQSQRAPPLKK